MWASRPLPRRRRRGLRGGRCDGERCAGGGPGAEPVPVLMAEPRTAGADY